MLRPKHFWTTCMATVFFFHRLNSKSDLDTPINALPLHASNHVLASFEIEPLVSPDIRPSQSPLTGTGCLIQFITGTEFTQSGCHGLKAGSCIECIDVWCSRILQTLLIASWVPCAAPHPLSTRRRPWRHTNGLFFSSLVNRSMSCAQTGLVCHMEQPSALTSLSCCCALALPCSKCGPYKRNRQRQQLHEMKSRCMRAALWFPFI